MIDALVLMAELRERSVNARFIGKDHAPRRHVLSDAWQDFHR